MTGKAGKDTAAALIDVPADDAGQFMLNDCGIMSVVVMHPDVKMPASHSGRTHAVVEQ